MATIRALNTRIEELEGDLVLCRAIVEKRMEQYFCAKGITDDATKVNTTTMYFTTIALLWWHHRSVDEKHGGTTIRT
ncbi:hypothetical protein Godav_023564 [Gossypium davidsonii]|uniref:Uncharacterized protein n=2 Tax=Gossypium TaxID=3633 RepID=A0A7J8SS32_GOSDV|nr:hypothetical protein [Gossypium davidsonii]MBA0664620.1 hypothetical protein [Gossypium klotzschianum]